MEARAAIPLFALVTSLSAGTYDHKPELAEECRVRDGLPNVFAKIAAKETVRIAYLGGSITAARGWRVKSLAWFRKQFPAAKFAEINAAISGTGSDFSACRLQTDVLASKPDLIFLECRVNGHGGFPVQTVEGIVRHTWQANPRTDICFVYTIAQGMLKGLQAGKQNGFGTIMERVANHYGIPTIDLGVEIAKQEADGRLIFRSAAPVPGKTVFARDACHPGDAGHGIYRDVIARSILEMAGKAGAVDHTLPEQLHERCWSTAALLPIREAELSAGWTPVDDDSDEVYNDSAARTKAMLRGAVSTDKVGETITVRWNGTCLGFSDIPHGGLMTVEVTVDGKTTKTYVRKQREMVRKYSRFFYLPELEPGDHTAILTVKELPDGVSFYAGQLLVVGELLP